MTEEHRCEDEDEARMGREIRRYHAKDLGLYGEFRVRRTGPTSYTFEYYSTRSLARLWIEASLSV
jgi:hypothetical protein